MGHGASRSGDSGDSGGGAPPPPPSRLSGLRRRLRLRRHRSGHDAAAAAPPQLKGIDAEDFAGIARIEIVGEKKVVLETNGPHIARISIFETNRFSRSNLVGYCEIDLFEILSRLMGFHLQDSENNLEELDLFDPSSSSTIVGKISIICYVEDPIETQKSFARRVLAIADFNEDGQLSQSEFTDLMTAFGNQLAVNKAEELFKRADKNGDGIVDMDELAILLADQQEKESLISNCPVCGEILGSMIR
uniref:EF-hand domain-containing protein n=1 Tax=Ananas comosus var. bracteatus TaxID=296719 RepID=A0A6V7P103_ANACO|nr:unnamed protein product [Ananas comosus var. bracteatus]